MRTLLVLLIICSWATVAWAKTVKVSKGSKNANQLHDELLARFPEWRGTQKPDGTFVNPLLRVEHTDQEITLTVPDDAPDGQLQAVINAHVPKPSREEMKRAKANSAKAKLKALGLTDEELDALFGR